MPFLSEKEVILFQGDSVTDCGRNRGDIKSLGGGYPLHIAGCLSAILVGHDFTFINKGVSGDRVKDLNARWDEDCINLQPTVVSILIGINDCWRRYDSNDPTSVEAFARGDKKQLERVTTETKAKIILLEPFLLPVRKDLERWREDLDPKIQAVRGLAREYNALYVPLDGLFVAACSHKHSSFWAEDGVHPTTAGHGFIAQAWINAVS
jgi:lysophospholipase L1-like esterase